MYHLWYILDIETRWLKNKPRRSRSDFTGTEAGRAPVLDWLRSLGKADRHAIGLDLMRV
jgi:hypothetical protein